MTQTLVELRSAVRPFLEILEAGDRVIVAVSGGADSLALAGTLLAESKDRLISCIGVTIDHQLQNGSAAQAEKVVQQLQTIGFTDIISEKVNVDQSNGLEFGARDARYEALNRIANENKALQIYLGHTKDDQAETVLLGLARGSGARSLSGMAVVNGKLIRPFLTVTRAMTEQGCKDLGLEVWSDPHNFNSEFSRVRIRTRVLPVMEEEMGQGLPMRSCAALPYFAMMLMHLMQWLPLQLKAAICQIWILNFWRLCLKPSVPVLSAWRFTLKVLRWAHSPPSM